MNLAADGAGHFARFKQLLKGFCTWDIVGNVVGWQLRLKSRADLIPTSAVKCRSARQKFRMMFLALCNRLVFSLN